MLHRAASRPVILVIEDDPVLPSVLQRHIRKLTDRYDIIHLSDGSEALAQLELRTVALVITDYNLLSSIDGLKVIAGIKSRAPGIPVVMISAYDTPELEQKAYAYGVDYYLAKPFLLNDLDPIVRSVLE